jgi:uncharacterized membrane protein
LEIERLGEKTGPIASRSNSEQANQLKTTLLANAEGRILLIGLALTFAYALWLGYKLLSSPEESQILTGMTATTAVFGYAASLVFGYSMGLKHSTVILIAMTIETIFVLIFYPLFVFSWRHLLVIKWLKNVFDRIHIAAETHKGKIQRYGIIGLFVFVWFPFWMTGPVVGCVIGFLLGLRPWVNMTVVLAGTYAAIFAWALFLRHAQEQLASYSSHAPVILMVLVVTVIAAGHLLHRIRHGRRDKT